MCGKSSLTGLLILDPIEKYLEWLEMHFKPFKFFFAFNPSSPPNNIQQYFNLDLTIDEVDETYPLSSKESKV